MEAETLLQSSEWISAGGILLILVGIAFLIIDFFVPSFGLFGFASATSILIGIVQLHQTGYIDEMPVSINALIALAIAGLGLSALGGWYSWKLFKKKQTTGIEGMIDETASILRWKDKAGHIHVQGEDWQAYSDTPLTLKKGDIVLISKIDGLKIKIRPQEN